jgi:hypothetical protein
VTEPPEYGKKTGTGKGRPPVAMRFKTGNAGRPKGSRNRSSVFAEALSDGDAIAIVEAVIGKAKKGDMVAARLVLDRLWPVPKGRAVAFDLPAATDANGIMEAHAALLRGLAKGVLTPDEAESVSRMLSAHLRVVENVELEPRMNEPFKFTLKIGQVSADGSRTVAEVRPEAGGGDVHAEYSQGLPAALPRES